MEYIITLLIMIAVYVAVIYLMKYMRNTKLYNLIFVLIVYVLYVWLVWTVYSDVGAYDWNFQNTLPMANVSPFMFSIVPLTLIPIPWLRKRLWLLISLLSVGMFLSTVLGCVYNAAIDYKFHIHFCFDYVSHFALSLFGVYLIRSRQVELRARECIESGALIIGAAIVMMMLNVALDTAFFGLSLNGKHNIYNNVLVESSYLSAILYFVGLAGVLCLGFVYGKLFDKDKFSIK